MRPMGAAVPSRDRAPGRLRHRRRDAPVRSVALRPSVAGWPRRCRAGHRSGVRVSARQRAHGRDPFDARGANPGRSRDRGAERRCRVRRGAGVAACGSDAGRVRSRPREPACGGRRRRAVHASRPVARASGGVMGGAGQRSRNGDRGSGADGPAERIRTGVVAACRIGRARAAGGAVAPPHRSPQRGGRVAGPHGHHTSIARPTRPAAGWPRRSAARARPAAGATRGVCAG